MRDRPNCKARTQKQGLELIHAGIRKEQRGIVDRDTRRARPKGVPVLLHEKIKKSLADLGHGPFLRLFLLFTAAHDMLLLRILGCLINPRLVQFSFCSDSLFVDGLFRRFGSSLFHRSFVFRCAGQTHQK